MRPDAFGQPLFRGPADALLALRVAAWLARAPGLMGRPDLGRMLDEIRARRPERPLPEDAALPYARRIARYADGWMRRFPFGRKVICWKRALAVYALLPAAPGELRIVFGVARADGGGLEGHAWVERRGVALDGTPPGRYRETLSHGDAEEGVLSPDAALASASARS